MPSRSTGVVALNQQDEICSEVGSSAAVESMGTGSRSGSSALRSVKSSVTALVPGILTSRWARPGSARRSSQGGTSVSDEEEIFINMLVKATYERTLSEDEVMAVLASCPEVAWLAECSRRTPLPEGWSKLPAKSSNQRPRFQCEQTGGVSDTPPHFQHFVHLAKLVTYARQSPAEASTARAHVQAAIQTVNSHIEDLERLWTGPHLDPDTGAEYYHCPVTGVSTWDNPFQGEMFLACVAERLLDSCAFKIEQPTAEPAAAGDDRQLRETPARAERSSACTAAAAGLANAASGAAEGESDAWAALDDLIDIGYEPTQKPETEKAWDAVSQILAEKKAHGPKNSSPSRTSATMPSAAPAIAPPIAATSASVAVSTAAPPAEVAVAVTTSAAVNPQEADAAAEVRVLRSTVAKLEQQVAELQSKDQVPSSPAQGVPGVKAEDMAALWKAMAELDARVHQKGANAEAMVPLDASIHPKGAHAASNLPRPAAPRCELEKVLSPRRRDVDQRAELFEGGAAHAAHTASKAEAQAAVGHQRLKPLPPAPGRR